MLASLSVVAFVHWRPFVKDANDNLAIVSQVAIFFTLLAALLKRVNVDETDNYDQDMFGVVLIFVNSIGATMVVFSMIVKPMARTINLLSSKHVHDAPLKGITEAQDDWVEFERYFRRLAVSDEQEAGWERLKAKHWGGKKVEMVEWLEETGAVGEWRCGSGDGPVDQARVTFVVEHKMDDVADWMLSFGKEGQSPTDIENSHVLTHEDGSVDIYYAVKMPWPFSPRDFKFQRTVTRGEESCMILSRSIADNEAGLKNSTRLGRVRATLKLGGYLLTKSGSAGEHTKIVYVRAKRAKRRCPPAAGAGHRSGKNSRFARAGTSWTAT